MSYYGRLVLFGIGTIGNAIIGILYYRVFKDNLLGMVQDGGVAHGPFTPVANRLELIIPVFIGLVQLFLLTYLIWGNVRQERARAQAPPR